MADRRPVERDVPADVRVPAPIWQKLRFDARQAAEQEPALASYLSATVLNHDKFSDALCYQLAQKAGGPDMSAMQVREICEQAYAQDPAIVAAAQRDMQAVLDRDPATRSTLQPFLFFKGFLALQTHRVAHWLWGQGRETLAFFLQSRTSELYGVDIHPAVQIGSGVFIDHATSIVIGETARIGDDVSMLQGARRFGFGGAAERAAALLGGGRACQARGRRLHGAGQDHGPEIRRGSLRVEPLLAGLYRRRPVDSSARKDRGDRSGGVARFLETKIGRLRASFPGVSSSAGAGVCDFGSFRERRISPLQLALQRWWNLQLAIAAAVPGPAGDLVLASSASADLGRWDRRALE
jgi:serine O-acetyltransferase